MSYGPTYGKIQITRKLICTYKHREYENVEIQSISTDDETGYIGDARYLCDAAGAVNNCRYVSSEHKTLTQCWVNVGPASQTLDQH